MWNSQLKNFAESIDFWVLRENTTSTSLSFIDRIWNLLSRKAQHQVRIYVICRICIWNLFSGGNIYLTRFVVICRIWNFVAFKGIVSTFTDDSSLHLVQFFVENDILIDIGSYLRVDLLLIQLFGSVLDRFVLGENIGLRTRISCYLTLDHACCFARIVLHVQPLRSLWDVYIIYLLSEKIVDFLRYVTIAIFFVFGVYLFSGQ